jgi:hypothetical protein
MHLMLPYADVCCRMLTYADVCCAGLGVLTPQEACVCFSPTGLVRVLVSLAHLSVSLLYSCFTGTTVRILAGFW